MTDTDKNTDANAEATPPKGERIAKVLARAGIASRREVERMIEDGRIRIHGKKLDTPATLVTSLNGIVVDGEPVEAVRQTKLWRMHKRRGTLTTHRDPEGRPTVFDKIPDHMGRVISVGRLDMSTEGLLLLTNDGELARWLELPVNSIVRKYRVRVHGRVNEKSLEKLKDGITINGVHYGAIEAKLERQTGANAWISIAIREGKNREVRRVMEHMELSVNRLIRTNYGPFSLGTLEDGSIAQVGDKQLYEVLAGYFKDAPVSVSSPEVKRDPSKWAKAKKPTKVKLGASRKRKFDVFRKGDLDAPETRRPNDRRGKKDARTDARPNAKADSRPDHKRYEPSGNNNPRAESRANTRTSGRPDHKRTDPSGKKDARADFRPSANADRRPDQKRSDSKRPDQKRSDQNHSGSKHSGQKRQDQDRSRGQEGRTSNRPDSRASRSAKPAARPRGRGK